MYDPGETPEFLLDKIHSYRSLTHNMTEIDKMLFWEITAHFGWMKEGIVHDTSFCKSFRELPLEWIAIEQVTV